MIPFLPQNPNLKNTNNPMCSGIKRDKWIGLVFFLQVQIDDSYSVMCLLGPKAPHSSQFVMQDLVRRASFFYARDKRSASICPIQIVSHESWSIIIVNSFCHFELRIFQDNFAEISRILAWYLFSIDVIKLEIDRVFRIFLQIIVSKLLKHTRDGLNWKILNKAFFKCEMNNQVVCRLV